MLTRKLMAGLIGLLLGAGAVQAGDTYKADAAHTTVGFAVTHMIIGEVQGRFTDLEGSVELDPEAGNTVTKAAATIQAKSINTNNEQRDEHLRNADFFDAEKYPTIKFESTKVEKKDSQQVLVGKFTMHGVTKEISLPLTLKGPVKDPWGKTRLGLKASIVINRRDYGLTWSKVMETGGLVVGDEVTITIAAEFVKQEPAK